ncbi:MAG TPA: hypothetical protein VGG66_11855 [Rhizomicrobium sp.]
MRTATFVAIALAGLAISACAPRYYDDDRYASGHYRSPPGYYSDRDRYHDPYDRGHYDDSHDHY